MSKSILTFEDITAIEDCVIGYCDIVKNTNGMLVAYFRDKKFREKDTSLSIVQIRLE